MRRIFYLITELDVGGAEKTLYELVTRLDRSRFEPVVACLTGRGPIGGWLEDAGVEVKYVDMRCSFDPLAWLRLRRMIRSLRPHVIHSWLFHANLAARLCRIGLGVDRVIASVRVEEPRLWHLWMDRLTRGLVDYVTCVSESARNYTHVRTGMPLDRLVAIPNGIEPSRYALGSLAAPPEWGIPEDAPVVAVIGRLSDQKDPMGMLRVVDAVRKRLPSVVFAFAGDGPLAAACLKEAKRLDVEANVRWLGWQADVRPLLARMSALALGSRWEGMPNVVLEAMAAGKPVVAAEVGGCPELIADGCTGWLTQPGDAAAMADRIVRVLDDPGAGASMGRLARERVRERFSLARMVHENESLYDE